MKLREKCKREWEGLAMVSGIELFCGLGFILFLFYLYIVASIVIGIIFNN